MSGAAHGGNDRLVSGTGNDEMWGDAQTLLGDAQGGNDTFVFGPNNGHDAIEDFGQGLKGTNWGTDHIDVSGLGIQNFSQLDISAFDSTSHTSTITFSAGDDVTVHSLVALSAQDFKLHEGLRGRARRSGAAATGQDVNPASSARASRASGRAAPCRP